MAEARQAPRATTGHTGGSRRPAAGSASEGAGKARRPTAAPEPEGAADPTGAPSPGFAGGHVCPVAFCPVGMALTFAEAARPEVVQHLLAAGSELMLAVKAMVDARAEAVARSGGLEHIRIR